MIRNRMPVERSTWRTNSAPFGASRTALVATAIVRESSRERIESANRSTAAIPRWIAAALKRPSGPVPSPSRGDSLVS